MSKKIALKTSIFLFVVMVPLFLLCTAVQFKAFDRTYYSRQYNKYAIPQSIGMDKKDLMDATEKLLLYTESKRESLNFTARVRGQEVEFFSERDKLHMVDVKNIFVYLKILWAASFAYIIFFLMYVMFYKKSITMSKSARIGIMIFVVGIVPLLLLAVLMSVDFYKYFTIFHEIFFDNDYWLLDPNVDRLINMYPQDFFSDTAFLILYYYLGGLMAVFIPSVSYVLYKQKRRISK